uniref:Uncharacterized protein n=1 Tax=Cyanophora sudae TaxID=1522369 RepID=A0A2Z4HFY1_9EUKA|nr:hypothetical protein [Cyanophora sudae]YP_009504485.1 hypothetical protein [Cyanophora sudae]AWW13680.1 hypothetical protein [Cyanophora sudae]AWW13681.1 hypothetical protein [Cyanophora sudae]
MNNINNNNNDNNIINLKEVLDVCEFVRIYHENRNNPQIRYLMNQEITYRQLIANNREFAEFVVLYSDQVRNILKFHHYFWDLLAFDLIVEDITFANQAKLTQKEVAFWADKLPYLLLLKKTGKLADVFLNDLDFIRNFLIILKENDHFFENSDSI